MSSSSRPGFPSSVRLLVALAALAVAGEVRAGASIEEVMDCAIRNLPPAAHGVAKVTTKSAGKEHSFEVDYWSQTLNPGGRKIVIAERNAPSDSISAYLLSDGDAIGEVWAFTRSEGKPRRIKSSGPESRLFDTTMSLEDYARFARVVFPGQVRRLADGKVGARDVYVVETRPSPNAGSEYVRIVTSIDREWCLTLRREGYDAAFENGAKPRKLYTVEPANVRHDGGYTNPTRAQQLDAKDGSTTQMDLLELEIPAKVDEAFFTPDALPSASH